MAVSSNADSASFSASAMQWEDGARGFTAGAASGAAGWCFSTAAAAAGMGAGGAPLQQAELTSSLKSSLRKLPKQVFAFGLAGALYKPMQAVLIPKLEEFDATSWIAGDRQR